MRFLHSLWPARIGFGSILLVELLGVTNILDIEPEFTWKGMILQAVFIWVVVEWVSYVIKRHDLNMSLGPVALLVMALLVVDAIGDMGHLYGRFIWYDQIMHFTGGFGASLLATGFLQAVHQKRDKTLFPRGESLVLGTSLSVSGQVLYEMEEYIEDLLTGSNRLGDGFDTVNDLTLGFFGAILAALIVVQLPRLMSKR